MTLPTRLQILTVFLGTLLLAGVAGATPLPLGKVPVPEPPNLAEFVKDKAAAIRLGKAFFWDMQAGSDGVQACASCHFSAGADSRLRNQLHPGPALPPATAPSFDAGPGPGYLLQDADFPFFQVSPVDGRLGIDPLTGLPLDPNVLVLRNANDIGGSQGVPLADFLAVNAGSAADTGTYLESALFGSYRQVTGRNAPSVINAVFNYANFWDGRANNIFNGENPLGPLDKTAGIWVDDGASETLVKRQVAIPNASLASQATGPPVSAVDMSFAGRSFPELGRKLLSLTPLGGQLVHPQDGVLGTLSRATLQPDGSVAGSRGIHGSYQQMIRDSFQDHLWNSGKTVTLTAGPGEKNHGFTQMEANFPLFWGLALQLYQATLVSDRTPFDRFLAGNADSLSAAAQNGFATFVEKCAVCHSGSELTSAVVGSDSPFCAPPDCNRLAFGNNSSHALIRLDPDPATFAPRLADAGFFNTGVRPTADDAGRGGGTVQGFPFPLSFTRLARSPGLPFATPMLPPGVSASTPAAVDGAFKTPGLRNVELTAPYFHNGSVLTLEQAVEFYTRGGNFPGNAELAGALQPIRNLRGNVKKRAELVEFLKSLTDERVRNQSAPFDHPELLVPSGDAADTMTRLAPTGGSAPQLAPVLTVDAVQSPTVARTLTFSGTVAPLSSIEVQVNQQPPAYASVTGSSWTFSAALPVGSSTVTFSATSASGVLQSQRVPVSVLPVAVVTGTPPGGSTSRDSATLTVGGSGVVSYRFSLDGSPFGADTPVATPIVLSALVDGTHTVGVLAKDGAGGEQPVESATRATWTVKAKPPLLTVAPPASPTRASSQTIGGSVELGPIPTVSVDTSAVAGPVTTVSAGGIASWSCTITGLQPGVNRITVSATDFVFNSSTVVTAITLAPADGNFKGSGVADLSDALTALRIAVGLVPPSASDLLHGDVSPLVNGVPAPDGRIDLADALTILRKIVGLVNF